MKTIKIDGNSPEADERPKTRAESLKDNPQNGPEIDSTIDQDLKSTLIKAFMSTPLPLASAAVGGVLIENAIGKNPSFVFGAFATYMGHLTGLKPLSALGLGMVTASYYSYRLENSSRQEKAKDERMFQTKFEHEELNSPSIDMFVNPGEIGGSHANFSPEFEAGKSNPRKTALNGRVVSKTQVGHFRNQHSFKEDLDDMDISEKLY